MDGALRETRISAAFVAVADTLVTDFDAVDLLHTLVRDCVEILDMQAGGEVMQLAADSGPCIDCFTRGQAVSVSDIADDESQWPEFRRVALAQGIHSVLATPMKLRGKVIGTMNLFGTGVGHVSDRDAAVAQALADVATIGLLQERVIREGHLIEEQLHRALDSRVMIEQAKGVIASSLSVTMDEAFALIRKYSRDRNLTIRAVAESVSGREIPADDIAKVAERTAPQ